MKLKLAFFSIVLLLPVANCFSQNEPIGQWKDYLSYQQGLTVCQGGGKFYCCCSSGLFSYNPSDNSIERYNKTTGLSDIGCTVARFNNTTNTLVIGYSDGNIDLLVNNQVTNIPDLKNSSATGSKKINNIYFKNNLAYISCAQGILVVDLNQNIILDEYIIGPSETALNVYSVAFCNDSLFAATANGIYKISEFDPNPGDFQDWQMVSNSLPKGVYNGIISCGANKMYAGFSRRLTNNANTYNEDTMFYYSSGVWSHANIVQGNDDILSLETTTINNSPYIVYSGSYNISAFDTLGNRVLQTNTYGFVNSPNPNDAILDNTMNFWVADNSYGLVESSSNYVTAQSYLPPGPFSNSVFDLASEGSNFFIAPGGYDQAYTPDYLKKIGVSGYSGGSWNRLIDTLPQYDTVNDLCCLAIDPKNPDHLCVGSWGCGVLEFNHNSFTKLYGINNSSLQDGYGNTNYFPVRIGGLAFDTNSNLWVGNSAVYSNILSVKRNNGTWQSFDFSGIVPAAAITSQLLVTHTGAKWLILPGDGILAYQDNGSFAPPNASNSVFINNEVGNGNLPSLSTYCITEDQNGAIWVGNNTQVVVFYSPDNVFSGQGGWDAQNVYVQQTGYTQYLMQNQFTTCIAVDGANRKWIGTTGGGVFLMSADGTQQILNFTSSNSPLFSNNILSIAINQLTGEVYIGTDLGVLSFQGTSTEGTNSFSNVYAYPDPVPHGYSGPIAIKNLVTNSDIKIATVSGQIVYHTVALGGQAIWYGTNFSGERVQTGVYLVFCTSPDGSQSIVTKLLFIN